MTGLQRLATRMAVYAGCTEAEAHERLTEWLKNQDLAEEMEKRVAPLNEHQIEILVMGAEDGGEEYLELCMDPGADLFLDRMFDAINI